MKRILSVLAACLACGAISSAAESMGTLTENGVSMEVKGVVALFDAKQPSLRFVLLPFAPTTEDIAKLQAKDPFWATGFKSPDTRKWADWCPYGWVELSWSLEKGSVGDAKKATVYVHSVGVKAPGSNLNASRAGSNMNLALVGVVAEGKDVTLIASGKDSVGKSKLGWNLKLSAKVVPLNP